MTVRRKARGTNTPQATCEEEDRREQENKGVLAGAPSNIRAVTNGNHPMVPPEKRLDFFHHIMEHLQRASGRKHGGRSFHLHVGPLNVDHAGIYISTTQAGILFHHQHREHTTGGVSVAWKGKQDVFEVEEVTERHPNVLTFEMVMAEVFWFVVGCYTPPSDLSC